MGLTQNDEIQIESSQYSCNADNSTVNLLTYDNTDCNGEPTATEIIEDDAEYFECTQSACPIFEWRAYNATNTNTGTCEKGNGDFVEGAFPINFCFFGSEYTCSENELHQRQYFDSAGEIAAKFLLNLVIPNPDTQMILNCTSEVRELNTLFSGGCNSGNGTLSTLFGENEMLIEVQQCGIACRQSVSLVVFVFVLLTFIV